MQVSLAANAETFLHFKVHSPTDHIPGGQILDRWGVAIHETFTLVIEQNTAFSTHTFGNQDTHAVDTRWVELEKFHILSGDAAPQCDGNTIAGVGIGIGSNLPNPAMSSGSEDHRFGMEDVQLAGG
jgi:hypothetical protein